MPKVSLAGFSDPFRRPKFIIWTAITVVILGTMLTVTLGITSSRGFCDSACHNVQDDAVTAFARSSHSQISCMACHLSVNADPVTFMLHKAEALGELYLTATDSFELPLNPDDKVAEDMVSGQCEQCHNMNPNNRKVTPTAGIIIDHDVHKAKKIACTMCHNRVAHKEDFPLMLPGNRKHEDWMKMEFCFRCHGLEEGSAAEGTCTNCHPSDYKFSPKSHEAADFYNKGGISSGHWKLQQANPTYCDQCHKAAFCNDCHGIPMNHGTNSAGHGALGRKEPRLCEKCHGTGKASAQVSGPKSAAPNFCNGCHHKGADPGVSWIKQHGSIVKNVQGSGGPAQCTRACHSPTECSTCHVRVRR